MTPDERRAAFREIAATLDRIDVPVYEQHERDPLEPIIGKGPRDARLAIIGRDPGRREVEYAQPFVGAAGQKVRAALHEAIEGRELPDFDASLAVGRHFFWGNTVPYKPVGNKAWPMKVQRAFHPLMSDVLVHDWDGQDVLCLGRVAFLWFGLGDKAQKKALQEHWTRDDRYEVPAEVTLEAPDGVSRTLRVWTLPHPSPLNRAWTNKFPGMIRDRLKTIGISRDTWRI